MTIRRRILYYGLRVLLLLVTLTLLVIGGEYGVRFVLQGVTTTGDGGSYFAKQWRFEEFGRGNTAWNSWRRREREFDPVKLEGIYRIAVIGDSVTFGQGIPEDQRYTNRLERALGGTQAGYEVLNFGWPGAETRQQIRMLEKVLKIDPDFVLLQWFVNDFEDVKKGRPRYRQLMPVRKYHYRLHAKSALYYVLNSGWYAIQERFGTVGTYTDYMHRRFGDPQNAESKRATGELRRLIELNREAGVPMGIVLFPQLRQQLATAYPFGYLHDRVLALCQEYGIPCVDLTDTFIPHATNIRRLQVNRFDAHPNGFANELAAGRMLATFGSLWRSGRSGTVNSQTTSSAPACGLDQPYRWIRCAGRASGRSQYNLSGSIPTYKGRRSRPAGAT